MSRRHATRGLACLLALALGCSSTTGGGPPDAAPDLPVVDSAPLPDAPDAPAPDVAPDAPRDAAPDLPPPDAAPDAADAGPLRCTSNRDCPSGTVCEYAMGCDQTAGTCQSDGCHSLPVAPQYCGCDGRTVQQVSACLPDRPYRAMGACPDGGAPDAGDAPAPGRYVDAAMLWQSPGGFAGWGPAVMVSGDGTVRFWRMRSSFTLDNATSVPPDRVERVTVAEAEELFQLWTTADTSMLPHRTTGGGECYPSASVRLCATCREDRVAYTTPESVLPEMAMVWGWFDRRYAGDSPRSYCAR